MRFDMDNFYLAVKASDDADDGRTNDDECLHYEYYGQYYDLDVVDYDDGAEINEDGDIAIGDAD